MRLAYPIYQTSVPPPRSPHPSFSKFLSPPQFYVNDFSAIPFGKSYYFA